VADITLAVYGGSRATAILADALQKEGVNIEVEQGIEQRSAAVDLGVAISAYIVCRGGEEAIRAVVRKVREARNIRAEEISPEQRGYL
jgi:hypothetical protein